MKKPKRNLNKSQNFFTLDSGKTMLFFFIILLQMGTLFFGYDTLSKYLFPLIFFLYGPAGVWTYGFWSFFSVSSPPAWLFFVFSTLYAYLLACVLIWAFDKIEKTRK